MKDPIPSVSIIVPVHRIDPNLERCIKSLQTLSPPPMEILLVFNGVSPIHGLEESFLVLKSTPMGAARARNVGSQKASGDILFFIDSDVEVPANCVDQVVKFFLSHPRVAAAFGVYKDDPQAKSSLSRIRNLFHRFTHLNAPKRTQSFWTGLGAIRSRAFQSVSGFDETLRVLEDVELGARLTKKGYLIYVEKSLSATHLKRWSWLSLMKADILDRAAPWTQLILEKRVPPPKDLNLSQQARLSAMLWIFTTLLVIASFQNPALVSLPIIGIVFWGVVNRKTLLFYQKAAGTRLALGAGAWLWFYYGYSLAGACIGAFRWLTHRLKQEWMNTQPS